MIDPRDKHKELGILLEHSALLKLSKEAMRMAENDPELLNAVYKEVSEKLGMDVAMEIYRMFKGQQISFPMLSLTGKEVRNSVEQAPTTNKATSTSEVKTAAGSEDKKDGSN